MATIAVSGSSGFIGSVLCSALERRGDHVVRLVRAAPGSVPKAPGIAWDPERGTIDAAGLEGLDAVVHLAGEGVANRRWSEAQKQRIKQSRARGTALLAETLSRLARRPSVLVCASAIGIYGDRGAEPIDETSAPGSDFLAEVCVAWEQAAQPAHDAGIRVVHTRFGIVLDPSGGALGKMLPPFRLGVGGKLGGGEQYMSWVTRDDTVRALLHVLDTPGVHGPVNVTAPAPASNAQFTEQLGAALHRPTVFTVPAFAARALLGEMADVALLGGARVLPNVLTKSGFTFQDPALGAYLQRALR